MNKILHLSKANKIVARKSFKTKTGSLSDSA